MKHYRKVLSTRVVGALAAGAVAAARAPAAFAQTTVTVATNTVLSTMPEDGLGVHTSPYYNDFANPGLPSRLDEAGITTLRFGGGGYADDIHWSVMYSQYQGGLVGGGTSPWDGQAGNYGYVGPNTDFGSFVNKLSQFNGGNGQAVVTVNYGSAMKLVNGQMEVPSHGGQPQEAAAWVAYANADPSIYGTSKDIPLGVDAEGNDWKTAGYWAKLRASTPAQYQTWATANGVYNPLNSFLAINKPTPVGIKYWEIGNETFGAGYYGGGNGYSLNYNVPYDGTNRTGNPNLSPARYGQDVVAYSQLMKAVDPTVKIGAVLTTPPDDYSWDSYNGQEWNQQVLSQCASAIDFAMVHWYPWAGNNADGSSLLSQVGTKIPQMINGTTPGLDTGTNAGLRDLLAAAGNPNAQLMVTEFGYSGSIASNVYTPVEAMYVADAYATWLQLGVTSVDFLELMNGNAFLSGDGNLTRGPAFYAAEMNHVLANPGDALVQTNSSSSTVRAHSAVQADGTVSVMLINEDTSNATINLSITGDVLAKVGMRYSTDGTGMATASVSGVGNAFSVNVPAQTIYTFLLAPPTWTSNGNGNWSTGSNWTGGAAPNGINNAARFGNASVSATSITVNVDSAKTVGALYFTSGSTSYTLGGTGEITLDRTAGNGNPLLRVLAGSHQITALLAMNDDTEIDVSAGSSLTVTQLQSTTRSITKDGAGALAVNRLLAAGLSVNAGTVTILPAATTSRLQTLVLGGTLGNWSAGLDLTSNFLLLDPPSSRSTALATLQDEVAFGRSQPAGIFSSTLPSNQVLAVLDNNVLQRSTFAGQVISSNTLIVAPVFPGDANADGYIDLSDLSIVLNNFGASTPAWTSGNFHNSPRIDLTDLSDVLNNFGLSSPGGSMLPANAAPEPSGLALVLPVCMILNARGRRRHG